MNMSDGLTFSFDLTVPAVLSVIALIGLVALWSPFLSGSRKRHTEVSQTVRDTSASGHPALPQVQKRHHTVSLRELRYWNIRLVTAQGAVSSAGNDRGQVIIFRRSDLR